MRHVLQRASHQPASHPQSFSNRFSLAQATSGPLFYTLRLSAWGLGMAAILLAFTRRYPLGANSGQLTDIGKLAAYSAVDFTGFTLGVLVLFVLYGLALHDVRRLPLRWALPTVFGGAILMALAMVWLYPVNAIDIFLYAVRSRLLTTYGVNPNAVPFAQYPDDVWNPFITNIWTERVSPYGPLWNLIAAPITWLTDTNMLAALVAFKLLIAAGLLASGWVLLRTLLAIEHPQVAMGVLFYLWNPLVLWEGVGNGHNDVLLMLLVLLALWAWATGRNVLVIPLLVTATLLKYVTLPLLPLVAVALWRRTDTWKQRWRLALWSGLLSGLAITIGLFPFYDLAALRAGVAEQSGIVFTSVTSFVRSFVHEYQSIPETVSWTTGIGRAILLVVVLWQCGAIWRRPQQLPRACFEAMFFFTLLAVASSRNWYLIWLVALAALLPWSWPAWRTTIWAMGALLSYCILIWFNAWWEIDYHTVQRITVLLILGGPVALTIAETVTRSWRAFQRRDRGRTLSRLRNAVLGTRRKREVLVVGFSVLSVLCWVPLYRWYALVDHYNTPRFELTTVPDHFASPMIQRTTWLFAALSLLYPAIYLLLRSLPTISRTLLWSLGLSVASMALIAIMIHPVGAIDMFYYLAQIKLTFQYGQNPYLVTLLPTLANDPLIPMSGFLTWPLVYGPAWLVVSWPVLWFGADSILPLVISYKTLSLLFLLASAWLIFRAHDDPRLGWLGAFLLLANPLVLFEGVVSAHNDVMMTTFLIAAVVALRYRRYAWLALPLGVVAVAIKALALPLLPVLFLAQLRRRVPLAWLVAGIGLSLLLTVVLVAPFWEGGALIDGYRKAVGLQQGIKTASLASVWRETLAKLSAPDDIITATRLGLAGLFVVAWFVITIGVRQVELALAYLLLLLYLLVSSLFPWYLIPVVGLLALVQHRAGLVYIFVASALALLSYPFVIWVLFNTPLNQYHMLLGLLPFLALPIILLVVREAQRLRLHRVQLRGLVTADG